MRFSLILLLTIFLVVESSLFSIPLILVTLICAAVLYKNYFVFSLAFLFGALLDTLTFNSIGLSSVFFVVFLFLILMYESKFEIDTIPFIAFSSFVGSFSYMLLMGFNHLILQTIVSTIFGVLLFVVFKKFNIETKSSDD